MLKFILKRMVMAIFTIWAIITIVFFMIRLKPGDPMAADSKQLKGQALENFKKYYGLDKPLIVQYGKYLKNLFFHFDFGYSMVDSGKNVIKTIGKYAPVSASYGSIALVIQLMVGIPLGILAAFKRDTWIDKLLSVMILIGICLPFFVFASLVQYFFCVVLKWFKVFSWGTFGGYFMPALALSFGGIATYCKYTRNSTLSVIGEDYIVTAKAKGVTKMALTFKHVLRNSLIPIITMVPPAVLGIFVGGLVTERIFSIPGLGDELTNSINSNDYPMIMGMTIVTSMAFVISLVVVDILYSVVDPRVKLS